MAFAYTQGGKGDERISMIKGKPFALCVELLARVYTPGNTLTTTASSACHFSFSAVQILKRFWNIVRSMTNAKAEPIIAPDPASQNPLRPYANPVKEMVVVYPIMGGKEVKTTNSMSALSNPYKTALALTQYAPEDHPSKPQFGDILGEIIHRLRYSGGPNHDE